MDVDNGIPGGQEFDAENELEDGPDDRGFDESEGEFD